MIWGLVCLLLLYVLAEIHAEWIGLVHWCHNERITIWLCAVVIISPPMTWLSGQLPALLLTLIHNYHRCDRSSASYIASRISLLYDDSTITSIVSFRRRTIRTLLVENDFIILNPRQTTVALFYCNVYCNLISTKIVTELLHISRHYRIYLFIKVN